MGGVILLSTVQEVSRREGISMQAALTLIRKRRKADAERIARDSYLGNLEDAGQAQEEELNPNFLGMTEYSRRLSRGA